MSKAIGDEAETAAAKFLAENGYKVLGRNCKTAAYEIDIIAKKASVLHFVEVKYRSNINQGSGLEYVTPKKLQQMEFAAQAWVAQNKWRNDYCLSAIEVAGPDFVISEFVPTIIQ